MLVDSNFRGAPGSIAWSNFSDQVFIAPIFNLDRLLNISKAAFHEAEDHLWLLQPDPVYLQYRAKLARQGWLSRGTGDRFLLHSSWMPCYKAFTTVQRWSWAIDEFEHAQAQRSRFRDNINCGNAVRAKLNTDKFPTSKAMFCDDLLHWCIVQMTADPEDPNNYDASILLGFSTDWLNKLIQNNDSERTYWQSSLYSCREFDAVGLILISAGVAFFLLPFNLYTIEAKGWGSSLVICFLVFGVVLIMAFAIWEKFFAHMSFIPWSLLKDRTVFGACLLSFTLFISYSCWTSYFTSFLQVVNNLSVTEANYVIQTYTVGGVLLALATGGFGVPLTILGMSLLIYFRQPDQRIGHIVMCMISVSFVEGVVVNCAEIAIMAAAAEQQYFAVSLAVLGLFGNIGSAIGLTISAAIWQGILPNKLSANLPDIDQADLLLIYESLQTQLSFPPGTTERLAIQHAYSDAQRGLLLVPLSGLSV
ncbi:hypothetical protein EAF00_004565 [Botryotinia globosa]|nr:hypothetical protein EAF00_004565 [Botryotinia globosa]